MRTGLLTAFVLAALFPSQGSYAPLIAVEGAYAIATTPAAPPKQECCSDCKGKGYIVHGDKHKTVCPCPDTCACKKGFPK